MGKRRIITPKPSSLQEIVPAKEHIYEQPMDTDNSVVKAQGQEGGAGWRWAKRGEMGDICNSINNKKMKKYKIYHRRR